MLTTLLTCVRTPIMNNRRLRTNTLDIMLRMPLCAFLEREIGTENPTANKKAGITISATPKPFHGA